MAVSSLLVFALATVGGADVKAGKAAGKIAGLGFAPTQAKVRKLGVSHVKINGQVLDRAQTWTLSFQVGDAFLPEKELVIWISTDVNGKLDGKTITAKPYKFGTDEYRTQRFGPKGSNSVGRGVTGIMMTYPVGGAKKTETESFSDQFGVSLKFGKQSKNAISGTISLTLPDKSKSYVKGTFTAEFSKW